MIIQLTTRCNMHCNHCCMSATKTGEDMEWHVFQRAFLMADEYVTLSGGEPTLWKHFKEMVMWFHANWSTDSPDIFMATNGTRIRNTMKMLGFMEYVEEIWGSDAVHIALSCDDGWHDNDMIHPKLYAYFHNREVCDKKSGRRYGQHWIRSVNTIYAAGRGKKWATQQGCGCGDVLVKPDGTIRWCACDDAPEVGDVHHGIDYDIYHYSGCYTDYLQEEQTA